MRILIIIFLQTVLLEQTLACTCRFPGSVSYEYEKVDAVFEGEIINISEEEYYNNRLESLQNRAVFEVKVLNSYKEVEEGAIIKVTSSLGNCSYRFRMNKTYTIYAYENNGKFGTNICTRTIAKRIFNRRFEYMAEKRKLNREKRKYKTANKN